MFEAITGSYNLETSGGSDYTQREGQEQLKPRSYRAIFRLSVLEKLQEVEDVGIEEDTPRALLTGSLMKPNRHCNFLWI